MRWFFAAPKLDLYFIDYPIYQRLPTCTSAIMGPGLDPNSDYMQNRNMTPSVCFIIMSVVISTYIDIRSSST